MVITERISQIMKDDEANFCTSKEPNAFMLGINLLWERSDKTPGDGAVSAKHDIIYCSLINDLPHLTENDVRTLYRLGFHLDQGYDCFAYHT